MTGKSAIFLGAAGLIAYTIFTKARALQTLNFYPKGVTALQFDGITPVLTLNLAVQNTSGQQMVLRSFAGNFFSNDYFIGNVSSYGSWAILPNQESILSIRVRLSLIGIVSNIVNAIQGGGPAQELELIASANVDNYQVPIKIKYRVGV